MVVTILLFTGLALAVYLFYYYVRNKQSYFKARGILYLEPYFLVGNTGGLNFERYAPTEFAKRLYGEFPTEKLVSANSYLFKCNESKC